MSVQPAAIREARALRVAAWATEGDARTLDDVRQAALDRGWDPRIVDDAVDLLVAAGVLVEGPTGRLLPIEVAA